MQGRLWRAPGLQTQWGLVLGGHHELGRRLCPKGEARRLHQRGQVRGLDFGENSNGVKEFNRYHSVAIGHGRLFRGEGPDVTEEDTGMLCPPL